MDERGWEKLRSPGSGRACPPIRAVWPSDGRAKGDAGGAAPRNEETETVLDWLALYFPSWGTSVVLHAALLVLAAFAVWQPSAPASVDYGYASFVQTPKPPEPEWREERQVDETRRPRDVEERRPPSPIVKPEPEPPGIGKTPSPQIPTIGRVGLLPEGRESDDGGPWRGPRGPERPLFVHWDNTAQRIVYVVDRSGSMTGDPMDFVKFELKRSIQELSVEKEFHVIFYSSGPPLEMPTRRLVKATERNKRRAMEFIDTVIAQGETDPREALERAFAVRPESIYLLTDGEFDRVVVGLVADLNAERKVAVHTIGFWHEWDPSSRPLGAEILREIADQNGGSFRSVSGMDLGCEGP